MAQGGRDSPRRCAATYSAKGAAAASWHRNGAQPRSAFWIIWLAQLAVSDVVLSCASCCRKGCTYGFCWNSGPVPDMVEATSPSSAADALSTPAGGGAAGGQGRVRKGEGQGRSDAEQMGRRLKLTNWAPGSLLTALAPSLSAR